MKTIETPTSPLLTLRFTSLKTYLLTMAVVAGNLILPQVCHLIPAGGPIWLPRYLFTLVGAYAYGWRVGLLTAIASPIVNSIFFGMPAAAVLPAILLKSIILALVAGIAAHRYRKATLPTLAAVVLAYQCIGTLAEWALCGSFATACQDFRIGLPGMAFQILGGFGAIKAIGKITASRP